MIKKKVLKKIVLLLMINFMKMFKKIKKIDI